MRASAAIRASSVVGGGAHEANRRRLGASDAGGRYPVPSRTAVAMSASSTSDTAAAAAASSAAKDAAANEASDWTSLRRASGVNLAVGHPGRLPDRVLARAMESAAAKLRGDALASDLGFRPADDDLARLGAPPLSYVARRGAPEALAVVSRFLSEAYAFGNSDRPERYAAREDSLMITNGVSHGLDLACAALTRPGDVVVVELPTYFLAADVFADRGLAAVGVGGGGGDGDGSHFDVDAFEARLRDPNDALRPRMLYLVPTHSNPRGGTLPERDRERLILLAREFGFFVVADEVYHLLHWGDEPPPRRFAQIEREMEEREGENTWDAGADGWKVRAKADEDEDEENVYAEAPSEPDASNTASDAASDASLPSDTCSPRCSFSSHRARARLTAGNTSARVVSLSSFSKILAPGARVGWAEAAPPLVSALADRGYVASGGCVAPLAAGLVAEAIALGDQSEWLETLRVTFGASARALAEAVEEERNATGWSASETPTGGYFLWVKLPEGVTATSLAKHAAREEVAYLAGSRCVPGGAAGADDATRTCDKYVRLCFAFLEEDELREGARRLARAVRSAREEVARRDQKERGD